MPRFLIVLGQSAPTVGMDMPDLGAAKCEAVRYAGRLLCDRASEFWDTGEFMMTVSDETGLTLFTLHFSAIEAPAIRASQQPPSPQQPRS